MNTSEFFSYILAAASGLATGMVQLLSGVDLGEAVYDGLTVALACFSVATGAVVVARSVASHKIGRSALLHGDVWTFAAFLAVITTGLSLWHFWLMLYWALADLSGFAGPEVEAAFRNWHVLVSATFSLLHLFLFRAMKAMKSPE